MKELIQEENLKNHGIFLLPISNRICVNMFTFLVFGLIMIIYLRDYSLFLAFSVCTRGLSIEKFFGDTVLISHVFEKQKHCINFCIFTLPVFTHRTQFFGAPSFQMFHLFKNVGKWLFWSLLSPQMSSKWLQGWNITRVTISCCQTFLKSEQTLPPLPFFKFILTNRLHPQIRHWIQSFS